MKISFSISFLLIFSTVLLGQNLDSLNLPKNSASALLSSSSKLILGGYGEVHFNQELNADKKKLGILDPHRVVMLLGYNFNEKTKFISEIEFEHVSEVYVEQAFIQHKLNKFVNFRAGLMLIPMGIINEYHEPTTFHGVERPTLDKYIAPTTWREVGAGFNGSIIPASLRYQIYVINGFKSYDEKALLGGKNGLRKGRQKGAESIVSSPNFTARIEFFGFRGLNIGASTYIGKTQSTLYDGLDKSDAYALAVADSSVVGVGMFGIDGRYQIKGFQLRAQYYFNQLSNTAQYNTFTADGIEINDLGNQQSGFYIEGAYNVLRKVKKCKSELYPFVRYESYNLHHQVDEGININDAYHMSTITTGLSWKIARGAVLKTDVQFVKSAAIDSYTTVFNAGFGVMF